VDQSDLKNASLTKQDSSLQSDPIQEKESRFSSGVYGKRPVSIIRGEGAYLWDSLGNEYIDCVGGQGSANIGHAVPEIAEAILNQAKTLIGCPEMFYNDRRAELEERLCSLTNMSRIFLSNSGTEAVEAAIKFSRILTGRNEILAAMRGFHGRTMGSLSATWEKKYRTPFEPLVPGFSHFSYNDLPALKDWKIGKEYKIKLVVKQVSASQGEELASPRDTDADKVHAKFEIVKVLEGEEYNKDEKSNKEDKKEETEEPKEKVKKVSEAFSRKFKKS